MSVVAEDPRADGHGVEQTSAAWWQSPVVLVMATASRQLQCLPVLSFPVSGAEPHGETQD